MLITKITKKIVPAAIILLALSGICSATPETAEARDARMSWWRDAKFGMFIHYGLYAGLAGEWKGGQGGAEWIQKNVNADTVEYQREALPRFNPKEKIADEWADLAVQAGCRYAVLTSKHHEGFAMFDSKETDYNSKAKFGRDFVREFTDAFRGRGLRVGLYHSVIDWHNADYDNTIQPELCYPKGQERLLAALSIPRNQDKYKKYLKAQVREILSNYGKIDIIWWDYSQGKAEGDVAWGATDLMEMCRSINPEIIMNNRLYAFSGLDKKEPKSLDYKKGDFTTPEKHIPKKGYNGVDWEACMTVGDKWGYSKFDANFKSVETIIRQLQECAGKGGNLLLNIGPRADGSVPAEIQAVFKGVGAWLRVNGEAIYATRPVYSVTDATDGSQLLASRSKNGTIYVFVPAGKKPEEINVLVDNVPAKKKLLSESGICPVIKVEP